MKFTWIDAEKAHWPVRVMCRALRVSSSGYYAWRKRPECNHAKEDRRLGVLVGTAFEASRNTYGSPRVHRALLRSGERVGRNRIIRLMRAQKLHGRVRRKFVTTTNSAHTMPVAPNLLDRDFTATAPNQRWVGDVTYLRTPLGFLYLAVVLDLYSRLVVGWALSPINDRHVVLRALDMAVRHRRPGAGLMHHSDRGATYTCEDYQAALEAVGIVCSMSRRGNCLDNAAMESWNSTLKAELGETFESPAEADRLVFDFIEVFYNGQRMHSTLGYVSPREFEAAFHASITSSTSTSFTESASGSPCGLASGAILQETSGTSRVMHRECELS